jgi:Flp pilus assembly pilin Flp
MLCINTIKYVLLVTFVSLEIIVYPTILGGNLLGRFEISVEVHLQVHYKPSVT